jgi:hypothetical protein
MKTPTSAKSTISVNFASISRREDGPVEVDVLSPRELQVKAGADLEQGADAAVQVDLPGGRLDDA